VRLRRTPTENDNDPTGIATFSYSNPTQSDSNATARSLLKWRLLGVGQWTISENVSDCVASGRVVSRAWLQPINSVPFEWVTGKGADVTRVADRDAEIRRPIHRMLCGEYLAGCGD